MTGRVTALLQQLVLRLSSESRALGGSMGQSICSAASDFFISSSRRCGGGSRGLAGVPEGAGRPVDGALPPVLLVHAGLRRAGR